MSARRPNILLLIADQLAPQAIGAYGADPSPTPNLDALAARGTRLTDVYQLRVKNHGIAVLVIRRASLARSSDVVRSLR